MKIAKAQGERTAQIKTHVCDQGHYGSTTCGGCGHDLGDIIPTPIHCPNCKARLIPGQPTFNEGGSDF